MRNHRRAKVRRGSTAVLAMLFLVLLSTLSTAMYYVATTNNSTLYNQLDVDRARNAADNGIAWISWVFQSSKMPMPTEGVILSSTAQTLWTSAGSSPSGCEGISQVIMDADAATQVQGAHGQVGSSPAGVTTGKIICDTRDGKAAASGGAPGGMFQVTVEPDPSDYRILHITSTGYYHNAVRSVAMDYWIDKGFDFAVWSSMGVQLGKNTVVEGNIAIPSRINGAEIIWSLSDFNYSKNVVQADPKLRNLDTDVTTYYNSLVPRYNALTSGNRIPVSSLSATDAALFQDSDGNIITHNPGYVDEYDIFLKYFGVKNGDAQHQVPYSSNVLTEDPSLVAAIKDRLGPRYYPTQQVAASSGIIYNSVNPANNNSDAPRMGWKDQLSSTGYPTGYNSYNDPSTQLYKNATQDSTTGLWQYWDTTDTNYPTGHWINPTIGDYDHYAKVTGQIQLGTSIAGSGIAMNGPVVNPEGKSPIVENASIVQLQPSTFGPAVSNMMAQSGSGGGTAASQSLSIQGSQVQNGQISNRTLSMADMLKGNYTVQVTDPGNTSLTTNGLYKLSDVLQANAALGTGKTAAAFGDTFTRDTSGTITGDKFASSTANTSMSATSSTLNHNFRTEWAPYTTNDKQAQFTRPVFRNITFNNVVIPKGFNAVFENCTFKGVTVIEHDQVSNSASNASNVRFQDSTINGPLIGSTDNAQSPIPNGFSSVWSNMWEFNGNTTFDNQWKDPNSNLPTVSVMAPQTYVDIGCNTDPNTAKVTMRGVCVAGMFDIRAAALVDGVLINCVDKASSSGYYASTLGFFGPSGVGHGDGPSNYNDPAGGLGYIILRQNRYMPLPNGVTIPIRVLPDWTTYREVH